MNAFLIAALAASPWQHYGANQSGHRHAADVRLAPNNASRLEPAWTFRTGDVTSAEARRPSSFKATPVLVGRNLIFSTGFNRVFAVDAATGRERWRFDPKIDLVRSYAEQFTSRGVTVWHDPKPVRRCRSRVLFGTLDARLFAIDAATGKPCADFGVNGAVDLSVGIERFRPGEYAVTSPPQPIGDVVVVGSSIGDNGAAVLESGVVRGFDVRTGELRWSFDPAPPGAGGGNVWTAMAADPKRGLVFLPTTSPSPDFFGGHRATAGGHANSLVALQAKTGQVKWSYRIVQHDLWDYDIASQPLLIDWPHRGGQRPAVVVATKMGFVFVLDRETGQPLHEVEERAVPASTIREERAAKTQRFPPIRLHPVAGPLPSLLKAGADHERTCRRMLAGVRYEGIFTPPSLEGTLLYPGNAGGTNWGSMSYDPRRGVIIMAVNRLPTVVKLIPRAQFAAAAARGTINGVSAQFTAMKGTPYGMARYELFDRTNNLPCFEGPYAQLFAIEVGTGRVRWKIPAGVLPGVPKDSPARTWGSFALGGAITTAGGLTFLGTPLDTTLRAYETKTGGLVWARKLAAGPQGTPMAYQLDGQAYVAIAAGGRLSDGAGRGDHLIAFRTSK